MLDSDAVATVADLRARLNNVDDTESSTTELQAKLDEAIRVAETVTCRLLIPPLFGIDGDEEVLGTWPLRRGRQRRIPDLRTASVVFVDGTVVEPQTLTAAGYELAGEPTAWLIKLPNAGMTLTIAGKFALYPTPEDLREAILALAARRYREKEAGYGDQVEHGIDDTGAIVTYFKALPQPIRQTFEDWRVPVMVGSNYARPGQPSPGVPLPTVWEPLGS